MTKEELLKLFEEMPGKTWMDVGYNTLDRAARDFLLYSNPIGEFEQWKRQRSTDRQMLKDGVDFLAGQLTIVLYKRSKNPAKIKGSFGNRVKLAKELDPPLERPILIRTLEELNALYTMSHDRTLISFSQDEWRTLVEKIGPPIPNLRERVYLAMFLCVVNLDQLGGNTR